MGDDHITVSRELQEDLLKESTFIERRRSYARPSGGQSSGSADASNGMTPGSVASGYVPAKTMGKGQCAFASVIQAIHGQMEDKDMTPYAYIYRAATAANSVLQWEVGLVCMTPFAFFHSHPYGVSKLMMNVTRASI
jgi:hypothetical protein